MKEYSNKEIKSEFGIYGIFAGLPKRLIVAKFIGGNKFLEKLNEKKYAETKIEILKNGDIEINVGYDRTSLVIGRGELKEINIEKKETIVETKSKSVVGRAVVGGLLLGPLGAVVGGMSGIGDKKVENKNVPEYLITFKIVEESGEVHYLFFESLKKNSQIVDKFFAQNLKDKLVDSLAV